MSDTVKLVIEISAETYEYWQTHADEYVLAEAIKNATPLSEVLAEIKGEIREEKECAYADFDKYKVDYLGADSRYVEDEFPYDEFRYGMERCLEIIDKHIGREGVRNEIRNHSRNEFGKSYQ